MSKTVIVDTSAWIEYFSDSEKAQKVEKFDIFAKTVSVITIFELYSFYLRQKPGIAEPLVDKLRAKCKIVPVTIEIATLGAELRRKHKFSMADALILATAVLENGELVTCDRDFANAKEVKVHLI